MNLIPEHIQLKLMKNWGEKADAFACKCECRIYDPASKWQWFIFAQDPFDEDKLLGIECAFEKEIKELSLRELSTIFNTEGDYMLFDPEYQPTNVIEQFKKVST